MPVTFFEHLKMHTESPTPKLCEKIERNEFAKDNELVCVRHGINDVFASVFEMLPLL